jgi:kynurenine formamidase
MVRLCWVAPLLLAAVGACRETPPRPFPGGALVDLSHSYDAQTIFWPTAKPFRLEKVGDGVTPGGYYDAANDFFTSEHGGTHVDAPIHFAQGHQTVDQLPLDRLLGPAVVIDVTAAAARDADYQVTPDDVQRAEARDGRIPDRAIVLIRTGYSRRWPDAATYLGTADRGEAAVAKLHFPGLHPDAAVWLIANRAIAAIGIDTASIDYGQSTTFGSHRSLFPGTSISRAGRAAYSRPASLPHHDSPVVRKAASAKRARGNPAGISRRIGGVWTISTSPAYVANTAGR